MPFDSAWRLRVRSQLEFCVSASLALPPHASAAPGCARRARRTRLRAPLRFQPKSDGTVVDQGHLHIGAEHAAFDPGVLDARRRDEPLEQAPS
jgi:hypothetical protein